jgi:hypothetical protein
VETESKQLSSLSYFFDALVILFLPYLSCRIAFSYIVLFWFFCGSMLLLLVFTVIHDEHVVQKSIKDALLRVNAIERSRSDSSNNPLHEAPSLSPDLRCQTAYVRIVDDHSIPSPGRCLINAKETTTQENIKIEYSSVSSKKEKNYFLYHF